MRQLDLLTEFGTDPKLLVRREDPETSHQAAHAVKSGELEKLVFETIKRFNDGCTQDDSGPCWIRVLLKIQGSAGQDGLENYNAS
jgi:hypothetical protein